MGIRLHYASITPDEFQRLQDEPELGSWLLSSGDVRTLASLGAGSPAAARIAKNASGLSGGAAGGNGGSNGVKGEGRSGGLDGASGRRDGASGDRGGRVAGDLEKAWHGLHFVLTGQVEDAPPPLGLLMNGGRPVGEDLGYGPARVLSPAEVRQLSDALQQIDDEEFDRRFDVDAVAAADIYPECWDEDRAELLEEYLMYLQQLKGDLAKVAAIGGSLLVGLM